MKRWIIFLLCFSLLSCSSSSEKKLFIFTWSQFFNPKLIEEFEKKHNCRVILDTFDSNESMYAKLKLGSSHYDIIIPSNYYLDILQNQGMIKSLEKNAIPNLIHLDPRYFKEPKTLYAVPLIVSFSGVAYRKDRLKNIDPSWGIFAEKSLSGRMTMLNDIREALGAALKFLGYSINTRDPVELKLAGDLLIQWKQNLAKFESEQYKNGIATAEFLVVQGYSIDIMQIRQEDENVDFLFPREGAILSIDSMVMPFGAKNVELASQFINFMLEPKNAAKNMNYNRSLFPVTPAYPLLDPELKGNPILFPDREILDKMELIEDLHEDIKLYYDTWERVKA